MNYRDAMAAIVQGDWVRHDAMQPGSYIAHSFADGPRINFPSGSSSGWTARDSDLEADWSVCGPEAKPFAQIADEVFEARLSVKTSPSGVHSIGWGNPPGPRPDNVGKWGKPPADLPPGHYNATLKVNANGKVEIDMVKLPAERDKWGRLTTAQN